MSERDEVLQRVYALMDQQIGDLRSEPTPDQVLEYGERKRQIAELLERLSRNDHSP